jgi:seryl-tRNA synthetase
MFLIRFITYICADYEAKIRRVKNAATKSEIILRKKLETQKKKIAALKKEKIDNSKNRNDKQIQRAKAHEKEVIKLQQESKRNDDKIKQAKKTLQKLEQKLKMSEEQIIQIQQQIQIETGNRKEIIAQKIESVKEESFFALIRENWEVNKEQGLDGIQIQSPNGELLTFMHTADSIQELE